MHPVTWFELNGVGPEGQAFYAETFGWTVSPIPDMDYTLVSPAPPGGIGGGLIRDGAPSTIVYVEVDDLAVAVSRAEAHGATVVVPPTEVPDMVTFAQIAAPDGNVIGLVLAQTAPPSPRAVLLYESSDDVATLAPLHYAEHSAYADQFLQEGVLVQIGPFGDPEKEGSMAIFTDRESAERFVQSDPFVLHGVVSRHHIRDWMA